MLNSHIIYLIGFMGSGKTTAGKKIASLLEWSFIDLDQKIEDFTGKKIPDIFSTHGEDYFRKIESEVLRTLKSQSKTVISTGGGTPCHGNNMDYMLETGLTIYLKLTPSQLNSRLSQSKGERPLLNELTDSGLQSFIESKLSLREKDYSRAEILVDGFNLDYSFLYSVIKNNLHI